jgi:hypothetical protein
MSLAVLYICAPLKIWSNIACNYIFDICRAAYKGFADTIRLLLFLGAYRGRQDKEGMLLVIS